MLDDIKFQLKLRRLQRARRKVIAKFQDRFEKAAKDKNIKDIRERLRADEHFELDEWDSEIDVLTTAHMLEQARRLQLPIPNFDDENYWTESIVFGGKHLTPDGIAKVRADIRAERKARWDFYSGHVTLLIGLLGALIGVISVLKK